MCPKHRLASRPAGFVSAHAILAQQLCEADLPRTPAPPDPPLTGSDPSLWRDPIAPPIAPFIAVAVAVVVVAAGTGSGDAPARRSSPRASFHSTGMGRAQSRTDRRAGPSSAGVSALLGRSALLAAARRLPGRSALHPAPPFPPPSPDRTPRANKNRRSTPSPRRRSARGFDVGSDSPAAPAVAAPPPPAAATDPGSRFTLAVDDAPLRRIRSRRATPGPRRRRLPLPHPPSPSPRPSSPSSSRDPSRRIPPRPPPGRGTAAGGAASARPAPSGGGGGGWRRTSGIRVWLRRGRVLHRGSVVDVAVDGGGQVARRAEGASVRHRTYVAR